MSGARFPNIDEGSMQEVSSGCGDAIKKLFLIGIAIGVVVILIIIALVKYVF